MAKAPKEANAAAGNEFAAIEVEGGVGGGDSRSIVLDVPMNDGSTKKMKRTDYIRARWAQKADRGTIRKEVSKLQNKEVPYQVIFAATKGQAGGPDGGDTSSEGAAAE